MQKNTIQIVAFNNPYPANFGGAIDMFYKIEALSKLGVCIHLHIFCDDRLKVTGLESLCEKIHLYKRKKSLLMHFSFKPYTILSRDSVSLVASLKSIDAPIFFESLRSCQALMNTEFSQKIGVRNHNIEHHYSWGLAKSESHWVKKLAHYVEGFKQKRSEKLLNKADVLFNISNEEHDYFSKLYKPKSIFLPVFHGYENIVTKSQFGKYALYHGDLSTADNIKSARFLIDVFKDIAYPLIIASSTMNKKLLTLIDSHKNISFQSIGSEQQLLRLIGNAHINTLYSFQKSGTKLKVFTVLFNGRHCILNKNMVDDSNLLKVCEIAETKDDYQKEVRTLINEEFVLTEERKKALSKYSNIENAKIIVKNLL